MPETGLSFYELGSIGLVGVGAVLILGPSLRLWLLRRLKERLRPVHVEVLHRGIVSVMKQSRFTWTEYAPRVRYRYMTASGVWENERLFAAGEMTCATEAEAHARLAELAQRSSGYFDPANEGWSCLVPDMSPDLLKHNSGTLAAGTLVCVLGLSLLALRWTNQF